MSIDDNVYEVGQVWFARRPGATCLVELEIVDKTKGTIKVKGLELYERPERYANKDIEFIELIEKQV